MTPCAKVVRTPEHQFIKYLMHEFEFVVLDEQINVTTHGRLDKLVIPADETIMNILLFQTVERAQ